MKILALDLGKSKSVGCLLDSSDNSTRYVTVKTVPLVIHDLLSRLRPDRVVLEVGTPSGWVHDIARQAGAQVQVANANHEGWRWRNVKRKTDRLDALKLAKLSAAEQLPTVYIPSRRVREHRALIGYRGQLVARRTRIKNTIRSLLARQGLPLRTGAGGWTSQSRQYLRGLAGSWEQLDRCDLWRGQLAEELDALEQVEGRIARVERALDGLGDRDERIRRLQTIPCVGPRTAELLVAVIDDPHRFRSSRQVGSYLGLVPRQYQSGRMDRSGRISKQGNRQLRKLLVEVSWLALRYNPPLRVVYQRICGASRSRRKIAAVAVARKLAVIAWAMLRDGTCWSPRKHVQAA